MYMITKLGIIEERVRVIGTSTFNYVLMGLQVMILHETTLACQSVSRFTIVHGCITCRFDDLMVGFTITANISLW